MRKQEYTAEAVVQRSILSRMSEFADVVHPIPLLCSLAIFFLLWKVGQLHEIYLAYLERPDGTSLLDLARLLQIGFAGGALALLSIALYDANYLLSRVTNVHEQSDDYDERRISHLRLVRNWAGALIAALPWFGVALGLFSEYLNAVTNLREIVILSKRVDGLQKQTGDVILLLSSASVWLFLAITILAVGGLAVAFVLHNSGVRSILSSVLRGLVSRITQRRTGSADWESRNGAHGDAPLMPTGRHVSFSRRRERLHYWSLGSQPSRGN